MDVGTDHQLLDEDYEEVVKITRKRVALVRLYKTTRIYLNFVSGSEC